MEVRSALLASMTDVEKSIKHLVIEANLRMVRLLAPHQDKRESTAGNASSEEIPEQHPDVSQPQRWRTTRVTIREPSSILRASAPPAPLGKGKIKATEPPTPIDESSNENDMSFEDVFEHYKATAASSGRKKDNKRTRGESSKTASKKARTEDPLATVSMKENTPPPSPLEQPASTPPVDQHSTPPTPVDQHLTPQDPTSQTQRTQPEGIVDHDRWLHRAGAMVSQTKILDTRLAEAKKALEGKNADLLDKNNELTKENDELLEKSAELSKQKEELLQQKATLTEELLESRDALKKSNEDREKFRESAKINYQEYKQFELDLIANRQETKELEKRCAIRLEEEERANIPASPEISLATRIYGADNEAGTAVDQDAPQDPPAF
ncbi:uncharacterized protein LOC133795328 [Humulus lupulus]|uniref:uncharacterized protein LOC133795328 n=1 Tax=Humulus lupulus TaxID=3486 RepID=UPI002B41647E|nr:uncharacterized protein LOC133795328 [Humulus lupulus]